VTPNNSKNRFEPSDSSFSQWLVSEAHVREPRRIVKTDETTILVSKVESGFAAELHNTLDLLGFASDDDFKLQIKDRMWDAYPANMSRVEAWRQSVKDILLEAGKKSSVPAVRLNEIQIGVDSVAALLDATLWTNPILADCSYQPAAGESKAYLENLEVLTDGSDIFTRFYGDYAGKSVLNHCPGALFARKLLSTGWEICSGIDTPKPNN
jgi:hypothetical protein